MLTRRSSALLLSIACAAFFCGSEFAYADTVPCELLTQTQVSAVAGVSVGAGVPIANTGCSWQATGKAKLMITVSMQSEKMFAAVKRGTAPKMPNTTETTVSGIGDEAIFVGVEKFSSLWVRKGAKFLLVRIYGVPVGEAQTKLKSLATTAVSKL